MKVRLIDKKTIQKFVSRHARSETSFNSWIEDLKGADWRNPNDIFVRFRSADLIGKDRLVFDIGGNNYRMICQYRFGRKCVRLFICWIGTHADYTVLCRRREQYTISEY